MTYKILNNSLYNSCDTWGNLRIYGKGDFRPIDGATCDHKTPISKGGDRYSYNNLAVCCYRCNMEKSDMGYSEWLEKIKSI